MRYMAAIVLAAALLSGCQGADKAGVNGSSPSPSSPAEESPTAMSAAPTTSTPSSEEEPLLYIEQLKVIGGGGQLIQVKSNSDIDKKSLEQAIKNSLQSSDPETGFRYTLEWESRGLCKSACISMRAVSGPGRSIWMKPSPQTGASMLVQSSRTVTR